MTKWKIREYGQQDYITLDVNPSEYNRTKQVEVTYEQLLDGSYSRIVAPNTFKKEDYQLVWADVTQAQLDILMGYINKKVEIVDHLLENSIVFIDGVAKQYLISAAPEQRYAVSIKVREV